MNVGAATNLATTFMAPADERKIAKMVEELADEQRRLTMLVLALVERVPPEPQVEVKMCVTEAEEFSTPTRFKSPRATRGSSRPRSLPQTPLSAERKPKITKKDVEDFEVYLAEVFPALDDLVYLEDLVTFEEVEETINTETPELVRRIFDAKFHSPTP